MIYIQAFLAALSLGCLTLFLIEEDVEGLSRKQVLMMLVGLTCDWIIVLFPAFLLIEAVI